jgi:hypothetical protein
MEPILFANQMPDPAQPIIIWDGEVKRWNGIFLYQHPVDVYRQRLGLQWWCPMPPAPDNGVQPTSE